LEEFQQNSLLTDVNMCLYDYDKNWLFRPNILLRILTKIASVITSIDSIESREIDLFKLVYNNNINDGNSHELKEMMEKTRVILTDRLVVIHALLSNLFMNLIDLHRYIICRYGCSLEDKMSWFCSWLYTLRNDAKPRKLRSYINSTVCASFIERIKKANFILKIKKMFEFFSGF
jgi:hypothetical protein